MGEEETDEDSLVAAEVERWTKSQPLTGGLASIFITVSNKIVIIYFFEI